MGASLIVSRNEGLWTTVFSVPFQTVSESPAQRHGLIRRATTVSRRVNSARPGANHSSRGHVTRSGTVVLSPNA